MGSKIKIFGKNINGLKPLIFVANSSNLRFSVGLDTSLILGNYKILFYSTSLSITIIFWTTFKGWSIEELFKNFFSVSSVSLFLPVSRVSSFFQSFQLVPPRSTPLHIRVGYIGAYVFA